MEPAVQRRLAEILHTSDEGVRLAEAALWVAKVHYPDLDVNEYLRQLDQWGQAVRARLAEQPSAEELVLALNGFLFEELGFDGNLEAYYDPRNSYLNEVMDRRLGIPITLSVVYLDVGRSIGLPLEGVAFPGHFLVKFAVEQGEVVLDPFSHGVSLTEENLDELLGRLELERPVPTPSLAELLSTADARDVLARMLRNLKGIYLHQGDRQRALAVTDLLVAVRPDQGRELRDRAALYQQLECFAPALADYQRYLDLVPEAEDAEDVRGRIIDLQRCTRALH